MRSAKAVAVQVDSVISISMLSSMMGLEPERNQVAMDASSPRRRPGRSSGHREAL
jgi:hypothetical protein